VVACLEAEPVSELGQQAPGQEFVRVFYGPISRPRRLWDGSPRRREYERANGVEGLTGPQLQELT
jgi:hypothetical protein